MDAAPNVLHLLNEDEEKEKKNNNNLFYFQGLTSVQIIESCSSDQKLGFVEPDLVVFF